MVALTLCLFAVTACNLNDDIQTQNLDEQNDNALDEQQTENKNKAQTSMEISKQMITDLGIYIGQADAHTVEIETNEGPKAFRITDRSADIIKQLNPDDKVKFEYYVNEDKQNILQAIEKMDESNNFEETGIYNGQQDSHTIEIETNDGPTAFQLSDNAKKQIASLQIGKKVTFTYRADGPQFIIESIEQMEE